jgi:phytepsin
VEHAVLSVRTNHKTNRLHLPHSILAAFYYGNITHPSVDPPKIGLLSTVPDNAAELLSSAVEAAENSEGGNFPVTTIEAPTGTWAPFTTNKDGVGMFGGAGETGAPGMGGVGGKDGANSGSSIVGEVALRMGWTMLVWVVGVVCTLVW